MNIARPSSGFVLREKPLVKQTLDSARPSCPWLDRAYADAVSRLRISGHTEGRISDSDGAHRSVIEVDPVSGARRLMIVYTVFADVLTIFGIRVLVSDQP